MSLTANKPSVDQIRLALHQLYKSEHLHVSPRLKNILKFVVEETLEGRGDALKEYTIATTVLSRDESFDPRLDTIVRTETRKLRSKLADYYASAGQHDPVQIELVKGSYSPRFHFFCEPSAELTSAERETDAPVHEALQQSPAASRPINSHWGYPPLAWMIGFAAVLCLAVIGTALVTSRSYAPSPVLNENRAGYKDYLRGQHFLFMKTPEGIRTAIDYFRQSIDSEPDFAPAYAGLSEAYGLLPRYSAAAGSEIIPLMRDASIRAIRLDPNLSEAHLTLAQAYEHDFDWQNAAREFKRTLQLAPKSAPAYVAYGAFLSRSGNLSEALVQMKKASELDPVSMATAQSIGNCLYWMRDFEQAVRQYQMAIRLDPHNGLPHQGLGMAEVQLGHFEKALDELKLARELLQDAPFPTAILGYAYAKSGQREKASRLRSELAERSRKEPIPAVAMAPIEIGLGNRDAAFANLERAVQQHDFNLRLLEDPIYDPLRDDERFRNLLQRMNLQSTPLHKGF